MFISWCQLLLDSLDLPANVLELCVCFFCSSFPLFVYAHLKLEVLGHEACIVQPLHPLKELYQFLFFFLFNFGYLLKPLGVLSQVVCALF